MKGRITRDDYSYYKNRLTNVIRRVKRLYYARLLFDASKDSKKLWHCLNNLVCRSACQSLKQIKVGEAILMGQELVNHVNTYFVNAVTSITLDINLFKNISI